MGQLDDSLRWEKITRARELFFERNDSPVDLLGKSVLRSWERCRQSGLEAQYADTPQALVSGSALKQLRERNHRLLSHGLGIVESLYEQVRDAGNVVVLTDASGMVLHRVGDAKFLSRTEQVSLTPGASWGECQRGTNAVGTALVERTPTEIFGREHFLNQNSFLTCSASPVFDPQGEVIGVLDISGDYRAYQKHTMGLVRMGVQLLERDLFESEFASQILVGLHLSPDSVGCVREAVLAVSADGEILGANKAAMDLLGVARCNLAQADFGMLFDLPLGALLDRTGGNPRSLIALETRGGGRLYARVKGMLPRVGSRSATPAEAASAQRPAPRPAPRPASRPAAPAQSGSLKALCTGDKRMSIAIDRAMRVLDKNIPILIQGESGVGKEMFAKAFHASGARSKGAFVALNCAAIPENLIESELFGYVGGAFTGARKEGAIGKICQADGGTLFLDEIGDMPLQLQARLLRVLQERSVTPIGGSRATPVDISLVCATHRNLREEIAAGRFREDLYYRVNGLTVTLPPLRERNDLSCLVDALLEIEAEGRGLRVSDEVMACFGNYDWPGNIRQLHNTLRLAVALLDEDETQIETEHLPEELFAYDPPVPDDDLVPQRNMVETPAAPVQVAAGGRMRLEAIERAAIDQAMNATGGNVSAAARRLGISRNTLYRKLGRL